MKEDNEVFYIEAADRVCYGEILFKGTREECEEKADPWFNHPEYGGIDVHIISEKRAKEIGYI